MRAKQHQDTQVHEDGDLKRYRTETPNLIYELRLTPFELALYSHFKRVAGAGPSGRCFKSTDTLAEETEMSPGMISKAKKGLLRTDRAGLNGKALIRVEKDDSRPGRPRDIVTIVDIWPENFLFFGRQSSPQSSYSELQSSPQSSPGECKNKSESLKNELSEEKQQQPLLPPQLPFDEADSDAAAQSPGKDAAAANSLRFQEQEQSGQEVPSGGSPPTAEGLPLLVLPEHEAELRLVSRALQDCGVTRCEADLLCANTRGNPASGNGGDFSLDDIRDQIAWMPYRNATNPGYWLPKYIRDGWPKPKALVEAGQREAQALLTDTLRKAAGPSPREVAEAQQQARDAFLDGLPQHERLAVFEDADVALANSPAARDRLKHKGKEGRGYQEMLRMEVRRIVDERMIAEAMTDAPIRVQTVKHTEATREGSAA